MPDLQRKNVSLSYAAFGAPRDVLRLETSDLRPLGAGQVRVEMMLAPINPSDLIPVTGAYAHLIKPPLVAGYEGVGRVVEAPAAYDHLLGARVLPLRGEGTWQGFVSCDAEVVVPVPDAISDDLAARGYINPLTAMQLLRMWPVRGKRVLLTGAGSFIAAILGQWALEDGAAEVFGIYRSPSRKAALEALGVTAVHDSEVSRIEAIAASSDIAFDAVGGALAMSVLNAMPAHADCVGYGLLSGQSVFPSAKTRATLRRFHLRDVLKDLTPQGWQEAFLPLWPRLAASTLPGVEVFELEDWRAALDAFDRPGRAGKPLLRLS